MESANLKRGHPIVFFDGECRFCNGWVRLLLLLDARRRLTFSPLQGATARRRLPPDVVKKNDSLVFERSGTLLTGAQAISSIARLLPFPWCLLSLFQWIPFSESLYRLVASHRHRIFGSGAYCPPPRDGDRFLH